MIWPKKNDLFFEKDRLINELDCLYKNSLICSDLINDYEEQLKIIYSILNLYDYREVKKKGC
jgi:hypothetical protein